MSARKNSSSLFVKAEEISFSNTFFDPDCSFNRVGKGHHLGGTLVFFEESALTVLCFLEHFKKFNDQSIALHLEDLVPTLGEGYPPLQADQFRPGGFDVSQRHMNLPLCLGGLFELRVVLVDQLAIDTNQLLDRQC